MSQYDELKWLAEACGDFNWRAIQENWCELAIRDDHAYIANMRTKSAKHAGPCPDREAKAKFLCAVTPAAVLALIAENDRLGMLRMIDAETIQRHQGQITALIGEGVHLKAENEALRKDAERFQWLLKNASIIFDKKAAYPAETGFIKFDTMPGRTETESAIDAAMSKEG